MLQDKGRTYYIDNLPFFDLECPDGLLVRFWVEDGEMMTWQWGTHGPERTDVFPKDRADLVAKAKEYMYG